MNRRNFFRNLAGLGLFSILPGAGRIWKAERRPLRAYRCVDDNYEQHLQQIVYRITRDREAQAVLREFVQDYVSAKEQELIKREWLWGVSCLDKDDNPPGIAKTIVVPVHPTGTGFYETMFGHKLPV